MLGTSLESHEMTDYVSQRQLAAWLIGVAEAAVLVLATALDVTALLAFPEMNDPSAQIEAPAAVVLALGLMAGGAASVVLFIVGAVLFCLWAHRANRNARALGAQGMEFTPGWTVGWFFIPIAHLFKPYQAIREIYRASEPDEEEYWPTAKVPSFFPAWWGAWIVSNILGNQQIALAFSLDPEALALGTWLGVVTTALSLVATVLVIWIIRAIGERQALKHRSLSGQPGEAAPSDPVAIEAR